MFLIAKNRSVGACHVDPANWLLDRWNLQADPRGPAFHDLAREPRDSCALQYIALPGDIGHPFPRRYFPWSFLHICFRRLPLIQSVFLSWKVLPFNLIGCCHRLLAFLYLYCSLELLLGLLDGSQQSCGQSIVRRHTAWPWVSSHSTGVKSPTTFLLFPSLGGLQLMLASPSSFSTGSSLPFFTYGILGFFCSLFLTISCQYTNVWYSAYLPLVSSHSFDNTGKTYNVSRIINDDSSFNLEAYKAYSPLFLSASFVVSYGLSFASITATLTHTFLFYRKQVWIQARRSLSEQPDTHARLMSVYKEVPDWWYLTIFGSLYQY